MEKKKVVGLMVVVSLTTAIIVGLIVDQLMRRRHDDYSNHIHYVQGVLAFAHYKIYKDTEFFLKNECYEAALTNVTEMQKAQIVTLAESIRDSGYDPELIEYIKLRAPKLLEQVMAGDIPELKPFGLDCTKNLPSLN